MKLTLSSYHRSLALAQPIMETIIELLFYNVNGTFLKIWTLTAIMEAHNRADRAIPLHSPNIYTTSYVIKPMAQDQRCPAASAYEERPYRGTANTKL
jgi:hypothetical protein